MASHLSKYHGQTKKVSQHAGHNILDNTHSRIFGNPFERKEAKNHYDEKKVQHVNFDATVPQGNRRFRDTAEDRFLTTNAKVFSQER